MLETDDTTPRRAVMTTAVTREAPPPVESVEARRPELPVDIVEQWGLDSFPASDPPANW
jgi:hypothetical protein